MSRRPRLLVTGFRDWRDLDEGIGPWRCRDNPSGRLLTGGATTARDPALDGPLVRRLRADGSTEPEFALLPVTWGAARQLGDVGDRFDLVVHLGLGVYDTLWRLQPERGAVNRRAGTDALGVTTDGPIEDGAPHLLPSPAHVERAIASVDGTTVGRYGVTSAPARDDNVFLCNETHWWALRALEGGSRLRRAFFLHLPHLPPEGPEPLADAVAALVAAWAQLDERGASTKASRTRSRTSPEGSARGPSTSTVASPTRRR